MRKFVRNLLEVLLYFAGIAFTVIGGIVLVKMLIVGFLLERWSQVGLATVLLVLVFGLYATYNFTDWDEEEEQ